MTHNEQITQVLSQLASAPARFASALSRLEDADSVTSAQAGEWSPVEVLAHVRASHDIIGTRVYYILVRDNPALLAYNDGRWAEVARYASLPVIESLEAMRLRRNELVRALSDLADGDWERIGTHEVAGPITVLQIAVQIADHDDEHIAQIEHSIGV